MLRENTLALDLHGVRSNYVLVSPALPGEGWKARCRSAMPSAIFDIVYQSKRDQPYRHLWARQLAQPSVEGQDSRLGKIQ
jgi:hypothetical protein